MSEKDIADCYIKGFNLHSDYTLAADLLEKLTKHERRVRVGGFEYKAEVSEIKGLIKQKMRDIENDLKEAVAEGCMREGIRLKAIEFLEIALSSLERGKISDAFEALITIEPLISLGGKMIELKGGLGAQERRG